MYLINAFALLASLSSLTLAVPMPQRGSWGGGNANAATRPAASTAAVPAVSSQPAAGSAGTAAAGTGAAGTAAGAVGTAAAAAGTGAASTAAGDAGTASSAAGGTSGSSDTSDSDTSSSDTGTDSSGSTSSGSGSGTGHDVTVINNCGGGYVEWKYNNGPVQRISGTQHISGEVEAGKMWLQGYDGIKCSPDGAGCGVIEFSLGPNSFNSINYSLLTDGLGNHRIHVPMYFEMHGPNCDIKAPGVCEGMTAAECVSGYTGTDTFSGDPPTCPGNDGVGVTIEFCPSG